jgi:NitT/TauT family transport system substrate-binding protein
MAGEPDDALVLIGPALESVNAEGDPQTVAAALHIAGWIHEDLRHNEMVAVAERGVAVPFRTPDQVKGLGPVQVGVIIYSGKFIKERRPIAQRWMNAYLKAADFFHKHGTKDPEVAAILEKYTKVPAKVIQAAISPYQDPNGRPLVDNLADQSRWFAANGMAKKIKIDNALDLSFLK